ncbi:MAG: tetratricopeptide repeat protein [Chitinophagales bacterium]|nr:tetratricopeptide repeat protein [Chitinophagales bacterium]
MEENEFQEPSFGEIIDLVRQYEDAERKQAPIFFEEENYEHIINFYEDNREYHKALRVVDQALEQHSFSSYLHTKKAEILANQRKFDEALYYLAEAEKLDPNDVNVFLIRADVLLWEGRHAEAMEEIEYALSIADEKEIFAELYLEMADIFEDQEKYYEVIDALKMALKHTPDNEEALNRFWFCTEITEKYEDSVQFHEALIEQSPYSYLAWFNLGHAYCGLGEYDKALEAFGYVMAIDDQYEPAFTCSGDVKFLQTDYNAALVFYQDAVKLVKPNKELYLKIAECFDRLNDYSKARANLRKAIGVDPHFDEAFYRIGETYRSEDKWTKAIASFERAVKLNRDNLDYLAALGDAYMSAGEPELAIEVFERAFQLDPQPKQNWINLATAYFNADNFRKAFQVLNEAEYKYDSSSDIFYIKAVFYNRAGNRHEALLNMEKGLLANFNEHTIVFEMDEDLLSDQAFLQVIEQYR